MPCLDNHLLPNGVRRLTLNRPQLRNAFNAELTQLITDEMRSAAHDSHTRVVVLEGSGSHFCAGGDIDWMRTVLSAPPNEKRTHAQAVADMYEAVYALPQPLVVAVQGAAIGGGFGLACCADFVVAENTAKLGMTEPRLGIVPAAISPYVVAATGTRVASSIALLGAAVDAEQARSWGVVTHITQEGSLSDAVAAVLQEVLQCAPGAQNQTKALFRAMNANTPTSANVQQSVSALVEAWSQPQALEGLNAFLAKCRPSWAPAATLA